MYERNSQSAMAADVAMAWQPRRTIPSSRSRTTPGYRKGSGRVIPVGDAPDRLHEGRMLGDVGDPLAIEIDGPPIPKTLDVPIASPHGELSLERNFCSLVLDALGLVVPAGQLAGLGQLDA